jgi:lipid II:glycine glycyltransferase (peptidoglycan interpeptide bridge formation enzyme)
LSEKPVGIKTKIKKTIDVQPSKTRILDLRKKEEDLLREMHQKTRYNIRLADRKGVEIIGATLDTVDELFGAFWQLMETTTDRDNFRSHSREYYRKMLDVPFTKLYLAKYGDNILAGAIVSFFGDTATYIHGASSNEMRNLMAPYLLQWEMIKAAQGRGCAYYDFYGVDEMKWPGVTRFKKGFGGQEIHYAGTYDFVFCRPFYCLYSLLRKLRRMI